MFAKVFVVSSLILGLASEVLGHAVILPGLGIPNPPVRGDVKRPSAASPCGAGVDVASLLDQATPVTAADDGTFPATVQNFNAGKDGSTQVTAAFNAAGLTTPMTPLTVTKNGILAPTTVGNQPITAQLPPGTICTGGSSGKRCLAAFKTAGGFGNCVVVEQGQGTAAAGKPVEGTPAPKALLASDGKKAGKKVKKGPAKPAAGGTRAARAALAAGKAAGDKKHKKAHKKGGKNHKKTHKKAKKAPAAGGTLAARALLAELSRRGESAVEVVKRKASEWIWA